MPCPHASGPPDEDPGSGSSSDADSRREFLKAAVAIGGASALAACARLTGTEVASPTPQFPRGPSDPSTLPARQHAWSDYLVRGRQGNLGPPGHQAFLFLEYARSGPPTADDRERVETALRTLERAYRRGTGGAPNALSNDGLLFTLGYAPSYFERFDADLPPSVDLPTPARVLDELDDDPAKADGYDAVLHLASDRAQVVLSAEEALFGSLDRANGVEVRADLAGVLERTDRRTGFVGSGLPSERLGEESIPERSPAAMGFESKFDDTVPGEGTVTIADGPFAGGTTQHVSRLELDLDSWYDLDHGERVSRMFSPEHTSEQVGEVGDGLGDDSGVTEGIAGRTGDHAERYGVVGHSQKLARARDEGFEPVILRRGDFLAPDEQGTVLHFGSLQAGIEQFVETRRAMDEIALDGGGEADGGGDVAPDDHGILGFIEVTNRANFLVPPRESRALPSPRP